MITQGDVTSSENRRRQKGLTRGQSSSAYAKIGQGTPIRGPGRVSRLLGWQCQQTPPPRHLGQVTNPVVGMHVVHLPVTTQEVLRVSPVPLQSGQSTWPRPLQRGQVAVSAAVSSVSIIPP